MNSKLRQKSLYRFLWRPAPYLIEGYSTGVDRDKGVITIIKKLEIKK